MFKAQKSFSTGEVSPDVANRSDFGPAYESAVSLMRNMIPFTQGPAESRHGYEFIAEIESVTGVRLIPLNVNSTNAFIVVITPEGIRIYDKTGRVTNTNSNIFTNGYFQNPGVNADWNVTGRPNAIIVDKGAMIRKSYYKREYDYSEGGSAGQEIP